MNASGESHQHAGGRQTGIAAADPLNDICGGIAAAFRRKWGRGPINTTARWAGPNMLVVLLENGHTEQEKALRAAGYVQQLFEGRRLLQQMLEDELKAIVERSVGREVITVLSATRLEPDLSAEIFLLTPGPPSESTPLRLRAEQALDRAREHQEASQALHAQTDQVRRRQEQRGERDG